MGESVTYRAGSVTDERSNTPMEGGLGGVEDKDTLSRSEIGPGDEGGGVVKDSTLIYPRAVRRRRMRRRRRGDT